MKIAVCQIEPKLLDIRTNLERIIFDIQSAREKGAQLIVFPELALTGYFVGDQYHQAAIRVESPEVERIVQAAGDAAVVLGFIEESKSMNFYNSALIIKDGTVQSTYRKLNLPNYGLFEERKYFSGGKQIRVFRIGDFNVAVFICNDMWHPSIPYLGVCQKADIFITILNSSEGAMGRDFSNIETWEGINQFYSRVFGIYNICANRVGEESLYGRRNNNGAEGGIEFKSVYWGGSEIIDPYGRRVAKAAYYRPDMIFAVISRDTIRKKKILLPYLRNDDPYFTHRELTRILFQEKISVTPE
jgi:predicted amidohydrolase